MSLKAFHIVFVSISILLSVGMGFWFANTYQTSQLTSHLLISIASFIGTVALGVYGVVFMRKLSKGLGYL